MHIFDWSIWFIDKHIDADDETELCIYWGNSHKVTRLVSDNVMEGIRFGEKLFDQLKPLALPSK